MKTRKWGVFVPPSGAAREVMISVVRTMDSLAESISIVDSGAYQKTIEAMMAPQSIDMAVDIWNQNWVCKALEEQWTHILVGALTPISVHTQKLLKLLGITSVHWFYEDFRKVDHWKYNASYYDLYCCVQREPLTSLLGPAYRFLPTAADSIPDATILPFDKKQFDLAFVGMPTPYRVEVIEQLIATGFKIAVAGPEWKQYPSIAESVVVDGWVNDETAKELYNLSVMGLNLSQENPAQERDFHQISPRVYDMAASGTIPVSESLSLGDSFFKEIFAITFSTTEALIAIIKQLTPADLSYERLVRNRQIIADKHTYRHRILQILEWVEKL